MDWFTGDELYDERSTQEVVETEQNGRKKHAPAKQKAMNFLEGLIQSDGWIRIPAVKIQAMAEERGITRPSLHAAKKELGLVSKRSSSAHAGVSAWCTEEANAEDLLTTVGDHDSE